MDGRARDEGRVYQASGDQHITEHHHHGPVPGPHGGPDSVRWPSVGRTPLILRDRTEVLDVLLPSIGEGGGGAVYVLHGMGGCGKTAVAHALFQRATTDHGRVGLWVNAGDLASLRAGMLGVAADRGAHEDELLAARNGYRPAADLVWDRLDRSAKPWLLVLDNTDNPAILRDGGWLRTSPRGTVVVTSRSSARRWWPGARLQHIGVLPPEDAAQVLCDLAPGSGSPEQAQEIADRLGRLPLALTLAGGFLSHQIIDPWTMDTYGRRLAESGTAVELIDRGADPLGPEDPRQLVGRTWQLTLDAFESHGLPEAVALLRLFARLAPEPLPLSVLNHEAVTALMPRARTETALRALLDHSLTELVDAGTRRCVRSHGVLLDSVAASTPTERTEVLDATAAALLDADVPPVPDAGPHEPGLRLPMPHILALLRRTGDSGTAARVLGVAIRLSAALHRAGDYLSASETARTAAELAEGPLGTDHRLVLAARSRHGRSLFRLGRYDDAETLLRATRATQVRLFGSADPDSLDSGHGLQLVLANSGHRDEALALLGQIIAGRAHSLGPRHPLTLRSRSSLLTMLNAAELTRDTTGLLDLPEVCAQHLGPGHTITRGARHNRAWARFVLGQVAEADAEIDEVVTEYETRFGPEYPITLAARQLHARTRFSLGDPAGAIDLMRRVTGSREHALGGDHPFTVVSRDLLATMENSRDA